MEPMQEGPLPRDRVGFDAVWRWTAPWLFGALLVAAALLGLFAASRAQDDGSYAIGFATAGLSLLLLAWRIKSILDGGPAAVSLLVEDSTALVVLILLLAALAVAGLFLAARSAAILPEAAGYALFVVALAFIFANLKHYFDRRDQDRG